jgi:fructokinase
MEQTLPYQMVCYGEVLWDILPSGALPGGAPMNVAYHLKKLGTNPAMISKVGLDNYGRDLVDVLRRVDISTEFVEVDYEHSTGLVYANVNDQHEVVYDIVNPSAWDFIEWKHEFSTLLKNAEFFVFGSLTSRNKGSRNTLDRLLDIAKNKVLDINLRPPHFNRSQVEYLLEKADILKMNISELELITGWFSEFKNTEDRIKLIQEQFRINTVIVTMGGDGAVVSDKGNFYRHPGIKVTVADTIGSGDAFLAGFLHQLQSGATIEQSLNFASAIGAFVATRHGACPEYDPSQIMQLLQSSSQPNSKILS